MGIKLFSTNSNNWDNTWSPGEDFVAPMFTIKETHEVNGHTIALVHYRKAKNYGGDKLLVYQNTKPKEVEKAKVLDPHFDEEYGTMSPFARLEPTEEGMRVAMQICWGLATDNRHGSMSRMKLGERKR